MITESNNIKKIAIARDSFAILQTDGKVIMYDLHSGEERRLHRLDGVIDLAAGFDFYAGLTEYGGVVTDGIFKNDSFASGSYRFSDWYDGKAVYACEFHMAMLQKDGRVKCTEGSGWDLSPYKEALEKWIDIKQLAITFERPFGLSVDGEFVCFDGYMYKYFNSDPGLKIIQIAAFGCYYSTHIAAALYHDGSVKAKILWAEEIEEVKKWRDIKKIGCGIAGAIGGLTKQNKLLIDADRPYIDNSGNKVSKLDNIRDFEMGFFYIVAVDNAGKLVILKQKR